MNKINSCNNYEHVNNKDRAPVPDPAYPPYHETITYTRLPHFAIRWPSACAGCYANSSHQRKFSRTFLSSDTAYNWLHFLSLLSFNLISYSPAGYLQAVIYNFVLANISGNLNQNTFFLLATFIQYLRPNKNGQKLLPVNKGKKNKGRNINTDAIIFGPFPSRLVLSEIYLI
nr:uncharacterized protein LOC116650230 [Drosophila virilis]